MSNTTARNSILLDNITREELFCEIENIVSLAIEKRLQPDKPQSYITKQEVADKLRLSLATVKRMTTDGSLKGYRVGRRMLFKADEIEQSLKEIKSLKYKHS
jgi:excisionase family DNA binding protein